MTRVFCRVLAMAAVVFAVLCGLQGRWVDAGALGVVAFVIELVAEDK